jgi:hypothetical protein
LSAYLEVGAISVISGRGQGRWQPDIYKWEDLENSRTSGYSTDWEEEVRMHLTESE